MFSIRRLCWLVCGVAVLGCTGGMPDASLPDRAAVEQGVTRSAKTSKTPDLHVDGGQAALEGLAEAAAGGKSWEVSVEGVDLPETSGAMVMTQKIGPVVSYKMAGTGGMHTINLKGAEKHEVGTFDPYMLQLLWTEQQYSCSTDKEAGGTELVVTAEGKGIRGELSGAVICRDVTKSDAAPQKGTVRGWFVD